MLEKGNPKKRILETGCVGFIETHVIRRFVNKIPEYHIYNLDAQTYAGNLVNLIDIEIKENYTFPQGNITNKIDMNVIYKEYHYEGVIHLAAESHVEKSITDPLAFAKTNILGAMVLLNAFRTLRIDNWKGKRFYHISTDEVHETLGKTGFFEETTPYETNSPYSASKASSDHFVSAYWETYDVPYVISNCSKSYGASQFPKKLKPLFINIIIHNRLLSVYEDGNYSRDSSYVIDHAIAIDLILHKGTYKETYNIGAFYEWKNIDLVKLYCRHWDDKLESDKGSNEKLITCVTDGPGYEPHYEIDASKINRDMGWSSSVTFKEELTKTTDWYLANEDWLNNVTAGAYQDYYKL